MKPARVVILGAGGLGCPAALALAEAARDRDLPLSIRLVDDDRVERSNLARQILFRDGDLGQPKAVVAAAVLSRVRAGGSGSRAEVGPAVERAAEPAVERFAEPVVERFTAANAGAILAGADVLLDGTDNFETRFAANDAALDAGIPLVHGAAIGFTGQLLTILPGRTACLRCLFEGPPAGPQPTCAEAGVAGPLCGLVGASMAEEALAILLGGQPRAASTLISWTGPRGRERCVPVPVDRSCRCAGRAARAS